MELTEAVGALAALAQPTRLEIFRLLVKSGDPGMCAGDIAKHLGLPKPTLSFHLKELAQAELLDQERKGRSMVYQVRVDGIRELMEFLAEDCCQGRPDLCVPKSIGGCC